jgi:hypothetical protein
VQCIGINIYQSTQILSFLSKNSYQDLTAMVSEPDSENGQAYATMRSLFDHTKRVYTVKHSFLQPTDIEITESAQLDVIRKANLASFVSSIFGSQEIGFAELNDHFLDVFVPEGNRLLKAQSGLYLDLKTQAFIAAMNNKSRTRTQLLYELFPEDMEQRLLARRPGSRQLAPSETDFVSRLNSRRDILLRKINDEEALKALPDNYHWEDFLRELSSYISKNFDAINTQQVCFYCVTWFEWFLMNTRERSRSKEDSLQAPTATFRRPQLLPTRASSRSLSLLRFLLIAICMATLWLVLLVLRRLPSRVMGSAVLSSNLNSNTSINSNHRLKRANPLPNPRLRSRSSSINISIPLSLRISISRVTPLPNSPNSRLPSNITIALRRLVDTNSHTA